jgi:signal transduction histidine kinase
MGSEERRRRWRSQPILLGEPGSAEEVAEVARLVTVAFGSMSVLLLVVTAMVVLAHHSGPPGYHPLAIAALSPLGFGLAVAAHRRPGAFGPATLAYLNAVLILAMMPIALLVGPWFAPLVTMFLVWFGAAITYLPRRVVAAHWAWTGLVYAALLVVQRNNVQPVVRWEVTLGAVLVTIVVMNRLAERGRALVRGEQKARAGAERDRTELEAVSEQKSRFLARMSHELRTPLNAIIGFSEVLARRSFGPLNAKQAEYVDDVVGSGRHLLALVDDLLDLAKVERGTVELELDAGDVELAGLLSGSLALFKEQAGRRRVALHLDVEPALGTIAADARKLKQVVFNLLANALRFTPAGGRVTLGAGRHGNTRVRLWVSDTGPGIAAEDQEAIFEEFRQGASAGGTQVGTGLGLPLARRLVEAHGGRLWVESEPGAGSSFTAELPVRPRPGAINGGTAPSAQERTVRLILGEPDSPDRRQETARLMLILAGSMAGMATLAAVIFRLHPVPELARYHEGAFALTIATALISMFAIAARPQQLASPAVLPYLGALAVTGVSVAAYAMGPAMSDFAAIFFGFLGASVFLVLTTRQKIPVMVLIGISYGLIVALQTGYTLPVARWLTMMEFVVVSGLIWGRLVFHIQALALAERAAGQEAEQVGTELDVASRHKTEFLANMSHELRTPLNAIIGFSEVLESQTFGPLNEKQAEYVADVLASGRHLLGLINDILDLAKADAGRMELRTTEIDLETMLAEAVLPFRQHAARQRVELSVEIASGLQPVEADEARLSQALGHLVNNALKFTPEGGRVTLRALPAGDHIDISVTDTGRGIDMADHERIFDAFAHGDDSSGTEQGSGLGLALARRYAQLHDGSLTVRSDLGSGATFTLRLPVQQVPIETTTPVEVA